MRKKLLCGILSLLLLVVFFSGIPTARAASALTSSDNLVEYVKSVEGFRAYPYWDYGQYTVGYGTRCPSDKYNEYATNGISEAAAEELLKTELRNTEAAINSFADKYGLTFSQNQFDALVTFTYNCGSAWLSEDTGTFNQAVRNGATGNEFISALCLWSTAGGEYILLDRRLSEAYMYLSAQYLPYNKYEQPYPDSYRWVFLNGCGGEAKYKIYAYDSTTPVTLGANFKKTPAGYTFEGWYTGSGAKITTLDSSISKDQVLYARWKDASGNLVSVNGDGPVNMTVTVTENDVNLRRGPGTHSPKVGTASTGEILRITEIHTTKNYVWGKSDRGWICMQFTTGGTNNAGTWTQENGKWAYYIGGVMLKNAWAADSTGNCYLGADGYMVTNGWVHDGNGWYYVDKNGHAITNTWKRDSVGWCYLGATGMMVKNQWTKDSTGWCYIGEDGYMVTNKWALDGSTWYYMDENGYITRNAWAKDGQGWCYLGADGRITKSKWIETEAGPVYVSSLGYKVTNGWAKDDKGWHFMGEDGLAVREKWVNDGVGWCYIGDDSYMVTNRWITAEDATRYLGADGYCLTNCWKDNVFLDGDGLKMTEGWGYDGQGWFYLQPDGTLLANCWKEAPEGMRYIGEDNYALTSCWFEGAYLDENGIRVVNGWITDDTGTYYLDAEGNKVTSRWILRDGKWSYVGTDGKLVSGRWVKDSVGWCYIGTNGYMVTEGWAADSIGMCYLGADGYMVKNRWVQDESSWFYIGDAGYILTNGWARDSKGWCYLDKDGRMKTNAWVQDSQGWCYVGADGYCLTNCWKQDSVGWVWLDSNGSMAKNRWIKDGRNWYYVNSEGYMLYSTSQVIGGKEYHFDVYGICTNP